jgi:hypothetical protein
VNAEPEKNESGIQPEGSGTAPVSPPAGAPAAPARVRLPSLGFLWLAAAALAVSAFLVWGLREPELDRAGRILRDLELGRTGRPAPSDLAFLSRTLERPPGLAQALLGGGTVAILSASRDGWIETEHAVLLVAPGDGPVRRIKVTEPYGVWSSCRILLSGRGGWEDFDPFDDIWIPADLCAGGVIEARAVGDGYPVSLADGFRIVVEGAAGPAAQEADDER